MRVDPKEYHEELEEVSAGRFQNMNQVKDRFLKFRERNFRPPQVEALDFIARSKKRVIVIEAPTGAGKSLIGLGTAAMFPKSIYCVHSKPLQYQMQIDFPEVAMLFGRNNYQCTMVPELTRAECPLVQPGAGCIHPCPYKIAKAHALSASLRVINYSYLLHEANFVGQFSGQDMIVVDEADALESVLYGFISISVSERFLRDLKREFPKHVTLGSDKLVAEWLNWAKDLKKVADKQYEKLKALIDSWGSDAVIESEEDRRTVQRKNRMQSLSTSLGYFINHADQSWIADYRETNRDKFLTLKPLWLIPELTGSSLWRHSARWVLMSATFPPMNVLAKLLGIDPASIDYLSLPSTFPLANRRVVVAPVAKLSRETMEEGVPHIIEAIRKILRKHQGQKGLIHCVSFSLGKQIVAAIDDHRLLLHDAFDKQDVLNRFRATEEPLVLVSPSSERGISLEDHQCRFTVIAKAPFLSLGDKSVKARANSPGIGNQWYRSNMILSVVQGMGRGVRHEEDYCIGYVLDEKVAEIMKEEPRLMPPWFREAVEFENPDVAFSGIDVPDDDDGWA